MVFARMERFRLPTNIPASQETQLTKARGKRWWTATGQWDLSAVYLLFPPQSGKFAGATADGQDAPVQGLDYAEGAAEHEQMTAVLRDSLQLGDTTPSVLPGLRTRTRASRGASKPLESCSKLINSVATDYVGSNVLNRTVVSVFI